MTRRKAVIWMFCILMALGTSMVYSAGAMSNGSINTDDRGLAIKGYDAVAYFTKGKPVKGKDEFSFQWKGAMWLFSNREHVDLFAKSPEKYAPQYGGY